MAKNTSSPSLPLSPEELIQDYRQAYRSRQASAIGRREVLSGKAKFGIFGDGKEIPQLAIAHFFKKGDWRSGYYRDQTWMFALGVTDLQKWFAALFAHEELKLSLPPADATWATTFPAAASTPMAPGVTRPRCTTWRRISHQRQHKCRVGWAGVCLQALP